MGRCGPGLFAIHLLLILAADAWAAPERVVCAILSDHAVTGTPTVALAQEQFKKNSGVRFVERDEIARALDEQTLSAAFAVDGPSQRIRLGEILKADLLVMVRRTDTTTTHRLDSVVCDARTGLRLVIRSVVPDDAAADAQIVAQCLTSGLERYHEKIKALVAIPPFICNDLTFEFSRDGAPYARVAEQLLLSRDGVFVAELAEARAIARELIIGGAPAIDRPLPLYVLGEYRNQGRAENRRVDLRLILNRGDKQINAVSTEGIAPADVALSIQGLTTKLLDGQLRTQNNVPNPVIESKQLHARAAVLMRTSDWSEAISLYEASLLLVDHPAAHRDAAFAIYQLYSAEFQGRSRQTGTLTPRRVVHAQLRKDWAVLVDAGVAHLEAFMCATPNAQSNSRVIMPYFSLLPPEESAPLMLRVLEYKRRAGVADNTMGFVRDLAWRDMSDPANSYRYATQIALLAPNDHEAEIIPYLLGELSDGKPTPELCEAIEKIAASDNPAARKIGEIMRARLARGLRVDQAAPFGLVKPELVIPVADPQVKLVPINTGLSVPTGWQSIDDHADLVWTTSIATNGVRHSEAWMLRDQRAPRLVARGGDTCQPIFDGRYLWMPSDGAAQIVIIDPFTDQSWALIPSNGLPAEPITGFAGVGFGPGTVYAAAFIGGGDDHRMWIGILHFNPREGPSLKIIHEARVSPKVDLAAIDPKVAFAPDRAFMLQPFQPNNDPEPATLAPPVVAFQTGGRYFTLDFPDLHSMQTGDGLQLKFNKALTDEAHGFCQSSFVHQGALFKLVAAKGADKWGLFAVQPRSDMASLINPHVPGGSIAITDTAAFIFCYDDASLYMAPRPEQPFVRLRTATPSHIRNGNRNLVVSRRFGLVLLCNDGAFQITTPDGKPIIGKLP